MFDSANADCNEIITTRPKQCGNGSMTLKVVMISSQPTQTNEVKTLDETESILSRIRDKKMKWRGKVTNEWKLFLSSFLDNAGPRTWKI